MERSRSGLESKNYNKKKKAQHGRLIGDKMQTALYVTRHLLQPFPTEVFHPNYVVLHPQTGITHTATKSSLVRKSLTSSFIFFFFLLRHRNGIHKRKLPLHMVNIQRLPILELRGEQYSPNTRKTIAHIWLPIQGGGF